MSGLPNFTNLAYRLRRSALQNRDKTNQLYNLSFRSCMPASGPICSELTSMVCSYGASVSDADCCPFSTQEMNKRPLLHTRKNKTCLDAIRWFCRRTKKKQTFGVSVADSTSRCIPTIQEKSIAVEHGITDDALPLGTPSQHVPRNLTTCLHHAFILTTEGSPDFQRPYGAHRDQTPAPHGRNGRKKQE